MKCEVVVAGKYPATITLANGIGTIQSVQYGAGTIAYKASNDVYTGKITLDGYAADFHAEVNGAEVSGSISYGWFFNFLFGGSVTG